MRSRRTDLLYRSAVFALVTVLLCGMFSGCTKAGTGSSGNGGASSQPAQSSAVVSGEESGGENSTADLGTAHIYYTNEKYTSLIEYTVTMDPALSVEEKVDELLTSLSEPQNDLKSIIPTGFRVVPEISYNDKGQALLVMYIRGSYSSLLPNTENVFRVGLAKSMISLKELSGVQIYANVPNEAGESPMTQISSLIADTIIVNESDENFFQDEVSFTLYFVNAKGDKLVSEKRTATVRMSERNADKVMAMLIEGPRVDNHYASMPPGSAVNEILIRNSVCYVDMNESFVTNQVGNVEQEMLTLYSIVNSLTSLYSIDTVQFLIDGQQRDIYKTVQLNTAFTFNQDYIETP